MNGKTGRILRRLGADIEDMLDAILALGDITKFPEIADYHITELIKDAEEIQVAIGLDDTQLVADRLTKWVYHPLRLVGELYRTSLLWEEKGVFVESVMGVMERLAELEAEGIDTFRSEE